MVEAMDILIEHNWPGNVRELEQCIRRILIKGKYEFQTSADSNKYSPLLSPDIELPAHVILATYCTTLYERYGTYEAVARITQLDRRTVKKYIEMKEKMP